MPRYRTISCEHCGYMQLKSDTECDRCGRMTKRAKAKAWATAAYFGVVGLVVLGFSGVLQNIIAGAFTP